MAQVIIKGRVKEITSIDGGTSEKNGKEWKRQEIIIEEKSGRFTNDVCLTALNNDVDKLRSIVEGSEVEVTGWVETRINEYNGKRRFNTSISIDNIMVVSQPQNQQRGYGNNQAQQSYRQPQQDMHQQYPPQDYQPQGMHAQAPDPDLPIFDEGGADF